MPTHTSTTPKPAELESSNSVNNLWPTEIKTWYYSLEGASDAYGYLDSLEADALANRRSGRPVAAEEINELRELAALAYQLKKRVNAAGSKVLALWDEDACDWRKPAPEAAEPTPRTRWDGEKWVDAGPAPVCACGKVHDDLTDINW